ncbi:hypothetical protein M3Y94_00995600 [Aphelenchoides besseyi]|nr:hypothetical protein M3Y94_00995600 [Aphelenchoides besseyi]
MNEPRSVHSESPAVNVAAYKSRWYPTTGVLSSRKSAQPHGQLSLVFVFRSAPLQVLTRFAVSVKMMIKFCVFFLLIAVVSGQWGYGYNPYMGYGGYPRYGGYGPGMGYGGFGGGFGNPGAMVCNG